MKPPINALLALVLAMVPAFASAKVQGTGIAIADVTLERIRVEREDRAIDDARRSDGCRRHRPMGRVCLAVTPGRRCSASTSAAVCPVDRWGRRFALRVDAHTVDSPNSPRPTLH
ncbi:hypothetical protein D7207_39180 [Burkholderia cepacia]|nr:hypothetical protein [Burkholderia cepacia]MBA9949319.1 hypothetical protein [Burkholderia cepacia]MBA9979613.1 hypothetical protein [Burkholderia cepacia]MBA9998420.1 hypothetical protein [Burkholderia cepacia]MBB0006389.1 hypothetical protein [Burkholderia cepacia]